MAARSRSSVPGQALTRIRAPIPPAACPARRPGSRNAPPAPARPPGSRYPYGFGSRFGDDQRGANPEEILGAAHTACFMMAFSFACEKAGFATTTIDTQAQVRPSAQREGFVIDRIALRLRAEVPGLDEARFQVIAASAKRDCPLRRALASVPEISLQATLEKGAVKPDA